MKMRQIKIQWLMTAFGFFLSMSAMAVDEPSEAPETVEVISVEVGAAQINKVSVNAETIQAKLGNAGTVQLSASSQSSLSACVATGADLHLKKEGNPHIKEQFSILLSAYNLKQPVDLKISHLSGVCVIEEIAVHR